MHYIRFLKSPSLSPGRTAVHVNAKITITTDLGESFLCFDLPIFVILVDQNGNHAQVHLYQWKAGKRELEISFSLPLAALVSGQRPRWPCKLLVQPRDSNRRLGVLRDMLAPSIQGDSDGLVLSVLSEELNAEGVVHHGSSLRIIRTRSEPYDQSSSPSTRIISKRVARHIQMANSDEFYIWEETGESIARHIWDAGLLLSAYLDSYGTSAENLGFTYPEHLKTLVSKDKLEVLELGTGCGVVGLTVAQRFPKADVLITDILEAEEIAQHNIGMVVGHPSPDGSFPKIVYQNLDWEKCLPDNLRNRNLDLILVADCTYNSDVVPDLVKTLADLVKYNPEVLILVSMKIRHCSEIVFFELMKEEKMNFLEKIVLPLPLLGQDAEEIELHFFRGG